MRGGESCSRGKVIRNLEVSFLYTKKMICLCIVGWFNVNIDEYITGVQLILCLFERPRRLFRLNFEALLFSIRLSMVTMAASLLALVVMIVHLPSVSVECVRSTPYNRI